MKKLARIYTKLDAVGGWHLYGDCETDTEYYPPKHAAYVYSKQSLCKIKEIIEDYKHKTKAILYLKDEDSEVRSAAQCILRTKTVDYEWVGKISEHELNTLDITKQKIIRSWPVKK